MASTLAARLDKLESAMPSAQRAFRIPIATTEDQAAEARQLAIAQGVDPDGDDVWCIRLIGIEPKRQTEEAAAW